MRQLPAQLPVTPAARPVAASVALPGSKSLTNRALLLAALCDAPVTLTGALFSEDTGIMIDALRALGLAIKTAKNARAIRVSGQQNLFHFHPATRPPARPACNVSTLSWVVLSATTDLPWGDLGLLLANFVQEIVKLDYFVAQDKSKINVMNSNVMWVVVVFTDYTRERNVKLLYRNWRESGVPNRTENVCCLFCQIVEVP